jgi:hypothetical protein
MLVDAIAPLPPALSGLGLKIIYANVASFRIEVGLVQLGTDAHLSAGLDGTASDRWQKKILFFIVASSFSMHVAKLPQSALFLANLDPHKNRPFLQCDDLFASQTEANFAPR